MGSETDYYAEQRRQENAHRYEDRVLARRHLVDRWEDYGFTEEDRDEILHALGLFHEAELGKNLDLYGGGNLSKSGLGQRNSKAVLPRTPPQRASSP